MQIPTQLFIIFNYSFRIVYAELQAVAGLFFYLWKMNSASYKFYDSKSQRFPVVGVGAFGIGLESLILLVRNIPPKNRMAFLLFLQDCEQGELKLLLSEQAKVNVEVLLPDTVLEPDTFYILGAGKEIAHIDGGLFITENTRTDHSLLPISRFFKSLASACKESARGIILSGNTPESSIGLKYINENGGITFIEKEENTSLQYSAADFVMAADEIPSKLLLLKSDYGYAADDIAILQADDEVYHNIINLVRLKTGNDFSHYKQPTIRRRIARRMGIAKIARSEKYLDCLNTDPKELEMLFNDILIPVTYFFRDSKVFKMLSEEIFPKILEQKKEKESIRIWIAGCSTGEEAYSMAILLHEFLLSRPASIKVQIFASDISENVIAKARAGVYSRQEVRNISEERLSNYFTKIDGSFHIAKEIRELCVFAVHNFVKDPPFAKLDMVSCRNVLIYLDSYLQKKAFHTFHYALLPSGMLFLGKSESTSHAPGLFEPLIKNFNIFRRHNGIEAKVPISRERIDSQATDLRIRTEKKELSIPDFQKAAESILFNNFTPAAVIVNENKEIIYFHGNTSAFLLPPQGKPNFNLLKMVREGLAFEVRSALLEAKTTQRTSLKKSIPVKGMDYFADIETIPLQDKSDERHYLVLFRKSTKIIGEHQEAESKKSAEQHRILLLEKEIEQLREDIRKVTEDQEIINEELQSANEELRSNSEELQTLNEELETSAEQLQSNNEELLTVNEELTDRQEQLVFARLYAEAIIENIREPLVIIDGEMRVRSANASFYSHFHTSEKDIEGRIVFDTLLGNGNLSTHRQQIEDSVAEGKKLDDVDVKIITSEGAEKVMVMNVRPVTNNKLSEPLALMAIEDITEILATNKLLAATNSELAENNAQLATFNSIASHDLQEPLRKISLFCNMVVEGEDAISEENSGYLNSIMASTKRMQQLIEDLLLYSKVSSARHSDFAETDLSQLVQDASDDLDNLIRQKNARLTVGEMPPLKIISPLVRQVFINLISNAIKYSKSDEAPEIQITSQLTKRLPEEFGKNDENNFLRISIKDNGIGFAQDNASRLFEPFFRLHSKERYEGSGIGLAICKKIMSHHSGYIDCTSEVGKGSVFNLYFPIFTK